MSFRGHGSKCANPLFLTWLEDWKKEAKQKGLNSQWTYDKAITSLKKYPLPLKSGKEATILENIGPGIASKLDKALIEYLQNGGDPENILGTKQNKNAEDSEPIACKRPRKEAANKQKAIINETGAKKCSKKEYIPKRQTGPYALLLTLLIESEKDDYKGFMTKDELVKMAEPILGKSLTMADPGSHYTPWSSMSTLISKGFVNKCSNPAKYSLTTSGTELGRTLRDMDVSASNSIDQSNSLDHNNVSFVRNDTEKDRRNVMNFFHSDSHTATLKNRPEQTQLSAYRLEDTNDSTSRPSQQDYLYTQISDADALDSSTPPENQQDLREKGVNIEDLSCSAGETRRNDCTEHEQHIPIFTMDPGSFDVVLCVDQSEVKGGANNNSKKMMLDLLRKEDIKIDVRKLQLGDFLWIARDKNSRGNGDSKKELVLDFIVERKRMDDLAGSIVDGRFKEQKFRLTTCGLKHVIYLVESFGSMQHLVLPENNLKQAIVNSQIIDELFIRKTDSLRESAMYLSRMTKFLQLLYEGKSLAALSMQHVINLKKYQSYRDVLKEQKQKLFTFSEFDLQTAKNKMLTVKEMFAKELMQLRGISADKATAIAHLYPTPRRLVSSFMACESQQEKENMLANLSYGKASRKIGPKLSKQIYSLYQSTSKLA